MNDGCAEGVGQAFVFFGFLKEEKTYNSLRIKGTIKSINELFELFKKFMSTLIQDVEKFQQKDLSVNAK